MSKKGTAPAALTAAEEKQLASLEQAIGEGMAATERVTRAGQALAEIRSKQLFRGRFDSFSTYCLARWNLTPRRCNQLVQFAGLQALLEEVSAEMGTRVPTLSEPASRPLSGLPPEEAREALLEAASSPEGVTAATVRAAAAKRKKGRQPAIPRPWRTKVPGATVLVTFNGKAVAAGATTVVVLEKALAEARLQAEARAA
jgi:hypothetical protein